MNKVACKGCGEKFDLSDMAFINNDEMPIVLDIQLKGVMSEKKAINYVIKYHGIDKFDYEDDDGKLHMYHYDKAGTMSHEEPGDEGHNLDVPPSGFWSFQ